MADFKDILEKRLAEVEDLPALPTIITQLEAAFQSDDSDAADVAEIITEDPVLASRVLKVANSVFYGISDSEIVSIKDAVARIGFAETRRLCTTLSLIKITGDVGGDLDHKLFWKHSLVVAVTTGVLAEYSSVVADVNKDETYMAGLLHDIGVLILDQYFADVYREIKEIGEREGVSRHAVEQYELGLDHGEIGGKLLEGWGLPKGIVEAVRWHHQPERAEEQYKSLVETVHLAEFVSTCLGVGDGGDGIPLGFDDMAWEDLDLSVDDIPEIIEKVKSQVEKCSTLVSLS